jgi:hypothetical protein
MTVARAISSPMPTSCRGRIRAASCRDLRSPQSTSEQLRRAYTPEVTSGGEFEPSIAHAVVVVTTITRQIDGFSCPIASDG